MPENPDHCVAENPDIPEILKVPEGHVLLLRANGRGVQKYTCPVNTPPKRRPMRSCLQATRMRGISWLSTSRDPPVPPGKHWMVARLWAKSCSIFQRQSRMALTGYCSKRNRRRAKACLVGSRTFSGSPRMAGNLLRRAATRQTIRPRCWWSIPRSIFSTVLQIPFPYQNDLQM